MRLIKFYFEDQNLLSTHNCLAFVFHIDHKDDLIYAERYVPKINFYIHYTCLRNEFRYFFLR